MARLTRILLVNYSEKDVSVSVSLSQSTLTVYTLVPHGTDRPTTESQSLTVVASSVKVPVPANYLVEFFTDIRVKIVDDTTSILISPTAGKDPAPPPPPPPGLFQKLSAEDYKAAVKEFTNIGSGSAMIPLVMVIDPAPSTTTTKPKKSPKRSTTKPKRSPKRSR